MKKSLAGLFVVSLLFAPFLTSAQATTTDASSTKAELIASLYTLLAQLEQEIEAIITQQQQIQATQVTQTQQIQQIAQNTQPVAGSIDNGDTMSGMTDDTPPASKVAIVVKVTNILVNTPSYVPASWVTNNTVNYPFGYYYLEAQVLDANGDVIPPGIAGGLTPISMTNGDETQDAIIDTGNASTGGYHLFAFAPPAAGTYQFTFTSGDLTYNTAIVAIPNAISSNQ